MAVPFKALTKTQRNYLQIIDQRGTLHQGWGGYGSTQTVRILNERGLIQLNTMFDRWEAQLTNAGVAWLESHHGD